MLQGTAIKCICRYEKMTLTSQKDVSYSLKSTVVVVSLITFSNYGMTFILSFKKRWKYVDLFSTCVISFFSI